MTGKKVGVVGMGRIGQAIAHRCHFGFGMEVFYFNRSEKILNYPNFFACHMKTQHLGRMPSSPRICSHKPFTFSCATR
ncbi:MAG: NAD(P)-dependent oxidoreductase [Tateyamaria sp.]|nr:NAD(P)-dependent oxidoreductase [Tateyamaria sp.]